MILLRVTWLKEHKIDVINAFHDLRVVVTLMSRPAIAGSLHDVAFLLRHIPDIAGSLHGVPVMLRH